MKYIRWFAELSNDDVPIAGGKNAALGEMYRHLSPLGIQVPNGFAITAQAYRDVITAADAWGALHDALDGVDPRNVADLERRAARAHALVVSLPIPAAIEAEIRDAFQALARQYGNGLRVAVRSSATAEDLPSASFAGQHVSLLNVRGETAVLAAYSECIASLFLERAIHYRIDQGFDHFKVALSVGVMKMVRSDLAASGVAFTLDTESGFRDVVFMTGAYGLGENVVQGAVDPDEFYVHKPTFNAGYRAVLRRRLGDKEKKLVLGDQPDAPTLNEDTPLEDRARFCLSDEEVFSLAQACIAIERHMSERAGVDRPMDVEWAKDGIDGQIYIVQARPETAASRRNRNAIEEYVLGAHPEALLSGRAVGTKIASGVVRRVRDVSELAAFQPGEVLVANSTSPDWEPIMKTASAIVTDRGGRTCHAAIVARELGIPALVGTTQATTLLRDGDTVTVSCAQGETGAVYPGSVSFERRVIDVESLPSLPVCIMLTLADPAQAFTHAMLPSGGVGLVRIEFIVSGGIGVHPMALAHPERLDDATRAAILERARGFAAPAEFFVQRLSEGVATIAAAFYPKPVVVRLSDFKSNEYARLLGGGFFERDEENPMIGFRGASRYTHPAYADGFALECAAMKRGRDVMGFENVVLMIPFCRRVDEGRRVVERMGELGLRRGERGLKVYVMCEIPNNVIQIDAFSEVFDGFSIGSNDLTQLVLGVDRDSEMVAFDFDERDAGVLEMLRLAITGAKRNGRSVGICGQAPSDYPDVATFLMKLGIDSISLNPDSVIRTIRALHAELSARTPPGNVSRVEAILPSRGL